MVKDTLTFEQALQALKEGKRIRRKTERKGFTKIVVTESKNKTEKFGSYWAGDTTTSDFCSLSMEDVLAADWIIDE